ncbi:MAG TPA: AAA family ATPase [Chloroflexota bacterium]|nr:AAA family ATPase [Chloroflexota bacterium]
METDSRSGVKAVRPWSRPGERYVGHRWPHDDGLVRGGMARYRAAGADSPVWDELTVARIERFVTDAGFVDRELNPLLALGEQLRRARGAVLSRVKRHSWRAPLERALRAAADRALLAPETPERVTEWCAETPEDAREALRALWGDVGLSPADHLGLFLHALPPRAARDPRERLALATLLLGALDPMRFPPCLEVSNGDAESDPGLTYRGWLGALDDLLAEAERRGLALASRLHAATVLHALRQADDVTQPAAPPRAIRESLLGTALGPRPEVHLPTVRPESPPLAALAQRLLIDEAELAKIVRLLDDRGQVVFYGPPGTGKTYVARALARHLAGSDEHVCVLQLHPSYAYEDFVEGYRPTPLEDGAGAAFALQDGPLKRIAAVARRHPSQRFVLVIDELNRANVSKVFGELYYLLEYRDESIRLQYSQTPFALPRNLSIVATMNAADRSIALVDLALRRRFYFVPFYPDAPPVEGLLRRWLETHHPTLTWVADVVDRANERLAARHDRHAVIGPSHFMRPDLTEEWVELIWEHSVLPTIAELFFGDEGAVEDFHLARLRPAKRPIARQSARTSPRTSPRTSTRQKTRATPRAR